MGLGGRVVLLAALATMLFAARASGQGADQKQASVDSYWLGPYFAGLRVTEEHDDPSPKSSTGTDVPEARRMLVAARIETSTSVRSTDRPRNVLSPRLLPPWRGAEN